MAWNEPGGNGNDNNKDNDPWSGRRKSQSPPDLDKFFQDFQKKVSGMLGGSNSGGDGPEKKPVSGKSIGAWIILLLIIVVAAWFLLGFYVVDPAERAVILRFGSYIETVKLDDKTGSHAANLNQQSPPNILIQGPGLHWIPPIIEQEYRVNVEELDAYSYTADMLTKDENIVSVAVAVQYRRADPAAYLFNVVDPIQSLQEATASALRQVIGDTTLDEVLTYGRDQVSADLELQLVELLQKYRTGIKVTQVTLQPAKPPEQVKSAFDDAINAQEDEIRYINKAEAYKSRVLPEAEGKAKRLLADAQAYQEQVVLNAQGDTARFTALLPEYIRSPKVTRDRLYLSAIEHVLQQSTSVFIDVKSGNNLFYLPIEKLIDAHAAQQVPLKMDVMESSSTMPASTTTNKSTNSRTNRGYLSLNQRSRNTYSGRER